MLGVCRDWQIPKTSDIIYEPTATLYDMKRQGGGGRLMWKVTVRKVSSVSRFLWALTG